MKLFIDIRELFPEVLFYINWAKNSKNIKTKRKLAKKSLKRNDKNLTKTGDKLIE